MQHIQLGPPSATTYRTPADPPPVVRPNCRILVARWLRVQENPARRVGIGRVGNRIMSVAHQHQPRIEPSTVRLRDEADHTVADDARLDRDFACLASVTHLDTRGTDTDVRRLRLVDGVTGVIDTDNTAEVHMIVSAASPRAAGRLCVERISQRLPHAVVTIPEIVDYNHALLSFLEQHGEHPDDIDGLATFDDAHVVAEVLDRV